MASASLTPEFRLIAACVRWPSDATARDAVTDALAVPTLDWHLVLALARRHRVVALVGHALANRALPPEIAAALEAQAKAHSWSELLLATEAQRLQRSFRSLGIVALLLKGPIVALRGFCRLGVRTSRDIDFLIRPADFDAARAMLIAQDYRMIEPEDASTPGALQRWMVEHKDMVFRHRRHGSIVELHWRLFDNPYLMPVDDAMRHPTEAGGASGLAYDALDPDIDLIYICAHGAQHAWSRLKWLADANALLSRRSVAEQASLLQIARRHHAERSVRQAMYLCHDLLGLDLPPVLLHRRGWRTRILHRMALWVMTHHGETELEDTRFATTVKNVSHYLLHDGSRYWRAEALYDLRDTRATPRSGSAAPMGAVGRSIAWYRRKRRPTALP